MASGVPREGMALAGGRVLGFRVATKLESAGPLGGQVVPLSEGGACVG